MNDAITFCQAFKAARMASDKTYREIGGEIGLSISRLCDIEAGRYRPPSRYIVEKLERSLGITDGHLAQLADAERQTMPHNLRSMLSGRPVLSELVIRLSKLSDKGLKEILFNTCEECGRSRDGHALASVMHEDETAFFN